MAAPNDKEMIVCLAFAYFADSSNPTKEEWYDLFTSQKTNKEIEYTDKKGQKQKVEANTPLTQKLYESMDGSQDTVITKNDFITILIGDTLGGLKTRFSKYLGSKFAWDLIRFQSGIKGRYEGANQQKQKLKISYEVDDKLKIAYRIAETSVQTTHMPNDLGSYLFLGQDDALSVLIKDDCLGKIQKAFAEGSDAFKGNAELYSSVDMFFVRRDMYTNIMNDYTANVMQSTTEELLNDMAENSEKTFRNITVKYFSKKKCIPISLKFQGEVNKTPMLTVVGETTDRGADEHVDPYTIAMSRIIKEKRGIDAAINDLIEIRFDRFTIPTSGDIWTYPIEFKYEKFLEGRGTMTFNFKSWTSGVFNGQWEMRVRQSGKSAESAWGGGMGGEAAEYILFRYATFKNTILKKMRGIRVSVFESMVEQGELEKVEKMLTKERQKTPLKHGKTSQVLKRETTHMMERYKNVVKELNKENILMKSELSDTVNFFNSYAKLHPKLTFNEYCFRVSKALLKGMKENIQNKSNNMESFKHAQFAYFLFNWGTNNETELLLKKKIFLTIFGVLTKSGYKVFDKNTMTDLIRKNLKDGKVSAYRESPFIFMSYH